LPAGPASVQSESRVTRIALVAVGGGSNPLPASLVQPIMSPGRAPSRDAHSLRWRVCCLPSFQAAVGPAIAVSCMGCTSEREPHTSCNRPHPRPARRKGASVCQNRKSTFSQEARSVRDLCNSAGPDHDAVGHRDGRNILAPCSKAQAPPPNAPRSKSAADHSNPHLRTCFKTCHRRPVRNAKLVPNPAYLRPGTNPPMRLLCITTHNLSPESR
jgi:hypothetical protein